MLKFSSLFKFQFSASAWLYLGHRISHSGSSAPRENSKKRCDLRELCEKMGIQEAVSLLPLAPCSLPFAPRPMRYALCASPFAPRPVHNWEIRGFLCPINIGKRLFSKVEAGEISGYVFATTITTNHYLARKARQRHSKSFRHTFSRHTKNKPVPLNKTQRILNLISVNKKTVEYPPNRTINEIATILVEVDMHLLSCQSLMIGPKYLFERSH